MIRKNIFKKEDLELIEEAKDHFNGRFPEIGEHVQLVSGSPNLTVVDFDLMGNVIVSWKSDDKVHEYNFKQICLKPTGENNG